MSRQKSPAYQRYPRDVIANPEIAVLSLEEFGAYEKLRDYIWLEEFLPKNEKILAKLLGISQKKFCSLWQAIEKLFQIDDDKIRCPELDEQRLKQSEWATKSRLGGIKSGEARRNGGSQMVQPALNQNATLHSSSSFSSSSSSSTSHPPLPPHGEAANGNGTNRVGVNNQNQNLSKSKFSFKERSDYVATQGHALRSPEGWLVKSESGLYDSLIERWIENGRQVKKTERQEQEEKRLEILKKYEDKEKAKQARAAERHEDEAAHEERLRQLKEFEEQRRAAKQANRHG